ncbi:retrovirus-related pol polyprotein from transposon TNT 1-94, partial [Tanacetum coccineum]
YSQNSKAYIILNKHTRKVEESLNATFDETPPPSKTSPLVDDDLDEYEAIKITEKKNLENDIVDETLEIDEIVNIKESRNHPLENVIGNLNQRTLRSQAQNQSNFFCFISIIKPKNVNEALGDEYWIVAMQEELNQFIANDVWELVPQPRNMTIIGTKWVFRNKLDENGVVSRNKDRLVAQGYNQQEGIDYDETYALVARLESIRILLAYTCALDFKLFQMDVKSAFLNGFINEEVYVAQPPGFIDLEKPDHVYKLKKALYCLKQAPKAWYDRLKAFLIKHEYKMGMVDNTLFTKKKSSNLIIVQIYVDDIIFGSTYQDMCDEFTKIMHDEFEMSMMGKLNFFLGLQIKQMETGACAFTDQWSFDKLAYGFPSDGPYQTNPPYPDDIISSIRIDREGQVCRIRHGEEIDVQEYQVLTREIEPTLKPLEEIILENVFNLVNFTWQTNPPSPDDIISSIQIDREGQVRRICHEEEIDVQEYQVLTREIEPTLNPLEEIIQENVFCLGGNQDHVLACLCYMLYCFVHSEKFNLAYYMAKRMEWITKQSRLILPYGMLLTRLFKFIINENPKLYKESYVLYDRVMTPLVAQLERKPRKDHGTRRGRHSTSSSTFNEPSSSHLNDDDDDDGNNEGTLRTSTPSPIRYVNSLTNKVPQVFQNPPNIDLHLEPFYTHQTKIINRQVQIRDEHRGGLRSIRKGLRNLWRNMKK